MPLAWFDLTEVRAFASSLVDGLHRVKAGSAARGDKMAQTGKRLDKLIEEANAFEKTQRLNVYKKAQLLAAVRHGLTEKGWNPQDREAIVNQLMTRPLMNRKNESR